MITEAICTSYKREILRGIHQESDTYKLALYSAEADLDESTTTYSTANEISGNGYTAGGAVLSGLVTGAGASVGWLNWSVNPSWVAASFTARGGLIYNASRGNRAVAVVDFGSDKAPSNGPFTVRFPASDEDNALIRMR